MICRFVSYRYTFGCSRGSANSAEHSAEHSCVCLWGGRLSVFPEDIPGIRFTRLCHIPVQSSCAHLSSRGVPVRVWRCTSHQHLVPRLHFLACLMGAPVSWPCQETAHQKTEQLRQEYMEIKALIDAAEATSTRKIKEEEKRVNTKFDNIYQILLKKKSEIQALKEEVELALTKGDEYEFLEVGLNEDGGMRFPPAIMLWTAGAVGPPGVGAGRGAWKQLRDTRRVRSLRSVTAYHKLVVWKSVCVLSHTPRGSGVRTRLGAFRLRAGWAAFLLELRLVAEFSARGAGPRAPLSRGLSAEGCSRFPAAAAVPWHVALSRLASYFFKASREFLEFLPPGKPGPFFFSA